MPGILSVGRLLGGSILGGFSPASLFASGEQGVWYDPSDMTTLFQNSAGTTPVTAVEQPVGLMLDKSKGLVLGSELATNGDFSNGTTGWAGTGGATLSVVSGALRITAASSGQWATTSVTTVVGRGYRVTFTLAGLSGTASTDFFVGSSSGGTQNGVVNYNSTGSKTFFFIATATTTYLAFNVKTSAGYIDVDNLSAKEIAGNHASQSTSASRPVLSARYNLLTYSEQFDNAAWTKSALTISANTVATTDPLGGNTAELATSTGADQIYQEITVPAGVTATFSMALKKADHDWTRLTIYATSGRGVSAWYNLNTGAVGSTTTEATGGTYVSRSITSLGDGWYRCSVTAALATDTVYRCINATANADSSFTRVNSGRYIWGADLRVTNDGVNLPAYQRVGAATYGVTNPSVVIGNPDYDTTGFPMYLRFDGTDDSMATSTINPGSVDKAQVFAGVRKLSDAAAGVIAELSSNWSTNNGSLIITAPDAAAAQYGIAAKGTSLGYASLATFAAPITNVLTELFDIGAATLATELIGRVNGTAISLSGAIGTAGTGNFGNYPLYIGSRAGTSLRFNGHLYSLIVRFSATNLPDATIAQTETWVNGKTGAY